ncbi:HTH-type transcriptional repressor RspR [Bradyrhizobium ivorense]|uniref:HTH-type transcriptional repressor RspR n=1 Tax=Bradyrhizobium ivorense TaxID=2511166 RepID=A0A508TQJ7_9BRAD|nr:GntR family transcriptional regulator [Bradyrhizobium ivorense]VIO76593.1 HTH-type transcriptional repressor RspR [Bradyrhizobium ivorense]
MPARAQKKSELRALAGARRAGRPRTATAAARIHADLRAELVSLQRRPGDPIPETEIALSYGVSRTPVREAILRLADEGLVEIFPQSGIFVSRIPLAALPEAIIVRRSLEETTTRMATERASSSQILGLHSILERQREADAADDREAFHQADEAFHASIADIAGHPGIWKLILQVKVHVDRFRRLTLPQRGRMAEVIAEHEAIMAAIEARDPVSAGAAMVRHLERLLADISATRHNNPEFFDQQS